MKTSPTIDPRLELATRILAGWELGQIVEQPSFPDGVARLALDLAETLIQQAWERGWMPTDA